jgi:hypothetical protein
MHDAHEQMRRLPDGLTPPLFQYLAQAQKPDELILIYENERKLCPVVLGAIEGAADRYGEQVHIIERTGKKRGDPVCRFEIRFSAASTVSMETPEQRKQQETKQQFAQFIFSLLPDSEGITLAELQKRAVLQGMKQQWARPALLLEALIQAKQQATKSSS